MTKIIHDRRSNREGSTLVTAVIMLAIAALMVGAILAVTMTYSKQREAAYYREKAAFLADAGLRAALVKLNADSDGEISLGQSKQYFADAGSFTIDDWGFRTSVTVATNGQNMLLSRGKYGSHEVSVRASVSLGEGSRTNHALYAHALFAGNSSGDTNYVLKVGGVGAGADFVKGDVYSGQDIELTGDSSLRLPEVFVNDFDGDGICDPGTDTWVNAYAAQVFTSPLSSNDFAAYQASMQPYMQNVYNNGRYDEGEAFVDTNGNGVYDAGEDYVDDRNSAYDYGTEATGNIVGMPAPGPGQRAATGGDAHIDPPDLAHMYYAVNRNDPQPAGALARWGNDITVTAADYGSESAITTLSRPEHIFVRNPPTNGSVSSGGKTIIGRTYTYLYDTNAARIDDYFMEDPTDSTYNQNPPANRIAQNDSSRTCTMFIDVQPDANMKLYYVDGNLYIHNPNAYSMRFRQPGTRITIVAKGNITISDEFYYNADYPANLQYADMNSTVVNNPSDVLCLIALKNPNCADSGNIYIGDRQFGTGGSIHAMLYAENDFVDNNINTVDQQYISVFGNMTAGNQVRLNREAGGSTYRTRLDVTLDNRIRDGTIIVPGLPHPVGSQRSIQLKTAWHMVPGTWSSWSMLR